MNNDNIILPIGAAQLDEMLCDVGIEVTSIDNSYSGRSMYGRECFGIVSAERDIVIGAALAKALAETDVDVLELVAVARTDNMGYDTIVYFPGYSLEAVID